MNTDIRILVSFRGHRKRKRLKRILGDGYLDYLVDLWIGAALSRPDGKLTGWTIEDIADEANFEDDPEILVNALVESGWLEKDENGQDYILHDWSDHQGWAVGAQKRSEDAKKAAAIRWHKHTENKGDNAERIRVACGSHAGRISGSHTGGNAAADAPILSLPILSLPINPFSNEKGSSPSNGKPPPCPHKKIIEIYHNKLPALPHIKVFSDTTKKHLKSRWREDKQRQCLEFWQALFEYISESNFLTGDNERGWTCDLSWIVKADNFAKIINGRYHKDKRQKTLSQYQRFVQKGAADE